MGQVERQAMRILILAPQRPECAAWLAMTLGHRAQVDVLFDEQRFDSQLSEGTKISLYETAGVWCVKTNTPMQQMGFAMHGMAMAAIGKYDVIFADDCGGKFYPKIVRFLAKLRSTVLILRENTEKSRQVELDVRNSEHIATMPDSSFSFQIGRSIFEAAIPRAAGSASAFLSSSDDNAHPVFFRADDTAAAPMLSWLENRVIK